MWFFSGSSTINARSTNLREKWNIFIYRWRHKMHLLWVCNSERNVGEVKSVDIVGIALESATVLWVGNFDSSWREPSNQFRYIERSYWALPGFLHHSRSTHKDSSDLLKSITHLQCNFSYKHFRSLCCFRSVDFGECCQKSGSMKKIKKVNHICLQNLCRCREACRFN